MIIEIRPGPVGTEGGEPFPEVREEIERMEKGRRIMRPSLMRLIPNRFKVQMMRKMFGFPNKDIAKGMVRTRTVCCLLAHERGGPSISHQVLIYPGVDLSGRF